MDFPAMGFPRRSDRPCGRRSSLGTRRACGPRWANATAGASTTTPRDGSPWSPARLGRVPRAERRPQREAAQSHALQARSRWPSARRAHTGLSGSRSPAIAYYVAGAVWFTPLFGRAWDRSIGHERVLEVDSAPRTTSCRWSAPCSCLWRSRSLSPPSAPSASANRSSRRWNCGGTRRGAAVLINNGLTPHTPVPFLFGAGDPAATTSSGSSSSS